MKFLVIDCETGGLDPLRHSLLQIAGVLWEPGKTIEPLFDIFIKESDKDFSWTQDAYKGTGGDYKGHGISIPHIRLDGIPVNQAVDRIEVIRQQFFDGERVRLAGHNVGFDVGFLQRLYRLSSSRTYGDSFGHRTMCTASILFWLMASGTIEEENPNFDCLMRVAQISIKEEEKHTAMGDALATARALEHLVTIWSPAVYKGNGLVS